MAAALVVIIMVFAGEALTYNPQTTYGSDASSDGSWSVSSSGTYGYDAMLLDSGTYAAPTTFMLYYDEGYGSKVNDPLVEVGARALDQEYYIQQLLANLSYLGVKDVERVNASQLSEKLSDAAYSGYGLIMLSGAVPDTVYDGTASSAILTWISNGGSLYWAGNTIGKYVGHSDGSVTEVTGYDALFLGASGCISTQEQSADRRAGAAYSDVTSNDLRYALHLKNNNILYGVETSKLAAGTYLELGFTENGYASIVFKQNGAGQVCVMAGDYSNHQRMDLSTVIAAGICWSTSVVDWTHGTVSKGTAAGQFDTTLSAGDQSIFVMLGGDFAAYGRTYDI